MTIDTGNRTVRIQAQKQIFAIVGALLIVLLFFGRVPTFFRENGIPRWPIIVTVITAYLLYRLYYRIRDVSYIYITDTELYGMLRVRHFRIRPLDNQKNAIEIPHAELLKYTETIKWKGLRRYITIWQVRDGHQYCYPPFSITILRRAEREQLYTLLDQYCPRNDSPA